MRYLLFGASTTFGEKDFKHGGWQERLRSVIDAEEGHRAFCNLAISGDTTREVLARMKAESLARIRDKSKDEWTILLSLGTNDSRMEDGEQKVPEDEFKTNVKKILDLADSSVGQVLWVGGNPVLEDVCNPWKGKEIYFINERIKLYGAMAKEVCDAAGVPFIALFDQLAARDDLRELYDADGLHPNARGHEVMFELISSGLKKEGIL